MILLPSTDAVRPKRFPPSKFGRYSRESGTPELHPGFRVKPGMTNVENNHWVDQEIFSKWIFSRPAKSRPGAPGGTGTWSRSSCKEILALI
jgi:hypothetical protein